MKEVFVLSKKKYEVKAYSLNLCLYSLSEKLANEFLPEVEVACKRLELPFKLTKKTVKKAELQAFKEGPPGIDAAVIIHKNEGRLLLTDENGLYNSLIRNEFNRLRILVFKQAATCYWSSMTTLRFTTKLQMS